MELSGGDEEFVVILKKFGFTSKLSLSHLQECEAGDLISKLNCGQLCLLHGLVALSSQASSASSAYGKCLNNIQDVEAFNGCVQH